MHNPGSDLSADELRTLKNIPAKSDTSGNDPAVVAALLEKGYVQNLLGGVVKTKKGEHAIRFQR